MIKNIRRLRYVYWQYRAMGATRAEAAGAVSVMLYLGQLKDEYMFLRYGLL